MLRHNTEIKKSFYVLIHLILIIQNLLLSSSFVKIFQQPGNAQNTLCPHMGLKQMKTEGVNLFGVSSPANAGGVFNPVSTMCAQVWWEKNHYIKFHCCFITECLIICFFFKSQVVEHFPHVDELNKHQGLIIIIMIIIKSSTCFVCISMSLVRCHICFYR